MTAPSRQPVHTGEASAAADSTHNHRHHQQQQTQPQEDDAPLMHFPHCRLEVYSVPHHHHPHPAGKLERIALPGPMVRALLARFEKGDAVLAHDPDPDHDQQQQPQPQSSSSSSSSSSSPSSSAAARPIRIQPHFDDADAWCFTRCVLADFTDLREDEAQRLSDAGRLCCWASVELRPPPTMTTAAAWEGRHGRGRRLGEDDYDGDGDDGEGEGHGEEHGAEAGGRWELVFVVKRVGMRDVGGGWCRCF